MSARCRSSSAAVISRASVTFQMSHMMQRQLQRLCGSSTRIGRRSSIAFIPGSVCPRGASSGPRCFAAARTQRANVGTHQHRRPTFDMQQLEGAARGAGKLARQIRGDETDAIRHDHERDGAVEQRLRRGSSLRADGDPICARGGARRRMRAGSLLTISYRRAGGRYFRATASSSSRSTGALRAESVASAIGMPERRTARETVRPSMARFDVGHQTSEERRRRIKASPAEVTPTPWTIAVRWSRAPKSSRACTSRRAPASAPSAQCTRNG